MLLSRRRNLVLAGSLLAGIVLAGLLARSIYLRSDAYRRAVQDALVEFFGLPVEVSSVQPAGWSARELHSVQVWLPNKRAKIFEGPLAHWEADAGGGNVVRLTDPTLTVGSEDWEQEDFSRVLRASLAHDFRQFDIRRIIFERACLIWPREDFRLTADHVEGTLVFDKEGTGKATFVAGSLNGFSPEQPIRILATVDPKATELLPEVILEVPPLPLAQLGLAAVLQSQVTRGSFAGKITLRQSPAGDQVLLQGSIEDVQLRELTARLPGGPVSAELDLTIEDAMVADRQLKSLRFHGDVQRLDVDSFLPRLGLPTVGGQVRLHVQHGVFAENQMKELYATGELAGGSLAVLTQAVLGRSGVQGRLHILINTLHVENNRLVNGDIDLKVEPLPDGTATIDRQLLLDLVQKQAGLTLPEELLPATVQFTRMDAKLVISDNRIRVLSGQGPAGPALITARIFGQNIPLLAGVDQTFPLDPLLKRAGERAAQVKDALKRKLATRPARATSRPSSLRHR